MIKQMLLITAFTALLAFMLMYVFQRHLIYYPSKEQARLNDYHAQDMRVITLHTQDDLIITSWYRPAKGKHPTLLYLHGNAGNIGGRMSLGQKLMDAGLGLLLLEYRGYGGNKGAPTEQGLYEDGRTAMRFLHEQGIKNKNIVLYGESLGTGVATKLGVEYPVCAAVLQSPYTSLTDMTRFYYPFMWLKPWDRFDSFERIQSIQAPILILHGTQDNVVPYSQGLALFHQAHEPKQMLSFNHKGHNDIWNAPGFSEEVYRFIKKYCMSHAEPAF